MSEGLFTEADWKLFRKKLPEWQENYMGELIKEYAQKTFGTIHKLDDTEFVFGDEHNINAVRLVKNNSGWCLEV